MPTNLSDKFSAPPKPSLADNFSAPEKPSLADKFSAPKEKTGDLVSLIRDKDFRENLYDDIKRFAKGTGKSGAVVLRGLGSMADLFKRRLTAESDGNGGVNVAPAGDPNGLQALGSFIETAVDESYTLDETRDQDLRAQVAEGAGSLPIVLAASAMSPIAGGIAYGAMIGQGGADDADQILRGKGVTDEKQIQQIKDDAFTLNIAVGIASELFLGFPALLKSIKVLKASSTPVARVAGQAGWSTVREGTQEGIEQLSANVIAKDIVGYDKERGRTEGVGKAVLLGALIGGPTGAVFQAAQEFDGQPKAPPEAAPPPPPARDTPPPLPIEYSLFDTGGGVPGTSEREDNLSEWIYPPKELATITPEQDLTTALDEDIHPTQEFPIKDIVINKDVPQFKGNGDKKTGVVEPLVGPYVRLGNAPIVAWKKKSGETEIITGRHRLELATRMGERTIPTQVVSEEDGFTRDHALIFDAVANIRDGQGDLKDYAQFFRQTRGVLSEEDARTAGLRGRAKGVAGWEVGIHASDDLFALYQNGQIIDAKAVAIARGAPGHEAAQASAIRVAKTKTAGELEMYARNLSRISPDQAGEADQMGFDGISKDFDAFEKEAEAVSKVQFERITKNKELILAAEGAARRPKQAKKMGLPVKNPKKLAAELERLRKENVDLANPDPEMFEKLRREAGLTPMDVRPPEEPEAPSTPPADEGADLFGEKEEFKLDRENQAEPEAPKPNEDDNTVSMFGDETKSTPPTDLDKANGNSNTATGKPAKAPENRGGRTLIEFAQSKLPPSAPNITLESQAESFRLQWEREPITGTPEPKPAKKSKPAKPRGAVDRAENYFKPGRIVKSYMGEDRVVSFKRGEADQKWTVTVHAVGHDGRRLDGHEGRDRQHSTLPNNREFAKWEKKNPLPPKPKSKGGTSHASAEAADGSTGGGDLGDPVPPNTAKDTADDPDFTAFPIELPEMVTLASDLSGGRMPKIVQRIAALGGRAAGVFRHGGTGMPSIELRADLFQLVSKSERIALREAANEYARAMKEIDPDLNEKDVAEEKYQQDFADAFEAAKKKNPKLASKVLAHEIGHWIDWLGDRIISGRGNLFGRIASLKGYTKSILAERPGAKGELTNKDRSRLRYLASKLAAEELERAGIDPNEDPGISPEEILDVWNNTAARDKNPEFYDYVAKLNTSRKKELVKAAMRGKVSDWVDFKRNKLPNLTKSEKEFYADLLVEEIKKRRLFELEEMKGELREAIAWWRGTEKMEKYFEPSAEMYAEAFSILINNPAALKKRAPKFYEAFFNYIESKPDFKELYDEIQDAIKSGVVHRERVLSLRESWAQADVEGVASDKLSRGEPLQERLDDARVFFDRVFGPVYRRIKQKGGGEKASAAIESFLYRATANELFLRRLNLEVLGPLTESNLDWVDLAEFMFHNHIIENRADIASSRGWNPKASQERLDELEAELGLDRWTGLVKAQLNYRAVYEQLVIDPLRESGVLDKRMIDILRERTFYATMSKVSKVSDIPPESLEAALRGQYGDTVSSRIYKQEGYLGDVVNPATATAQKAMSLMSMVHRETAKREIVKFLLDSNDPLVQEAPTRLAGKRREPVVVTNTRVGTMIFLDKGKVQAYYVPRTIHDAFERGNPIDQRIMANLYNSLSWVKSIYTDLNYGFWAVATKRDIRGFARKMPGASMYLGDRAVSRYLLKARKAARASLKGTPSELANEALARQMVISRADPRGDRAAENSFERLLLRYGMRPETFRLKNIEAGNKLAEIWRRYRYQGQVNERMVKIAGMLYLDEHFGKLAPGQIGVQMPEGKKQEIVHEAAGSPNFLQRPRGGPMLDMFFLFYNPWKEGLRSEWRAWNRNPFEMIHGLAMYTAPLTVISWMLERGLMSDLLPEGLGDEYQEMFKSIPEYDKTSYHIIPIMWADEANKKVLYIRLPLEEGERMFNGVLRKSLTAGDGGDGILSYAGGQVPGMNPIIQTSRAWFTYMTGGNPNDAFRGRNVIPKTQFDAGEGLPVMARWTWNQLGGSLITRMNEDNVYNTEATGVESFLQSPGVSNLLGRWIKVSNRGLADETEKLAKPVRKRRAQAQLLGRSIVMKLTQEVPEELTENESKLLREDEYLLDYVTGLMIDVKINKQVSPEIRQLLNAKSNEERAVIAEEQNR